MAEKRSRDTTVFREDTRRALGQIGNVMPRATPVPVGKGRPKNPVSVGRLIDPAAARAAPKAKRPAAPTAHAAPTDALRHNEMLDDVFGDAPAAPVNRVQQHLADPSNRLGHQLRFLRRGLSGLKGAKAAEILGHIDGMLAGENLHDHAAGLQRFLAAAKVRDSHLQGHIAAMHDNYNWDTLARNLHADAHGYARHLYATDEEHQRALRRRADIEDDRRFLASPSGPVELGDADTREETPASYLRYVQETWGDRAHHARLERRKGLYGLIAPDGTWHAVPGMYGHGEVARSLGFPGVHEALTAGYMHVATDGAYHREIHGHNPAGSYTPAQLSTFRKRADGHLCYTATVHRVRDDGKHVSAPIRLARLDHVAGALGRAVAAGLGHLMGGEVTEGTGMLGAGLGAATGARLFGPGLAAAYRKIEGWLKRRRGTQMDPKTKALSDEAERLIRLRSDEEEQTPVSARALHTLRTALRLHGHPETHANDPDMARFWHYNVHPHVESAVTAGHAGTLKAAVDRGVGLLRQHGYLGEPKTPPSGHTPTPDDLFGQAPPDAAPPPRAKPKRTRRKPKKSQAPGLFDEFE